MKNLNLLSALLFVLFTGQALSQNHHHPCNPLPSNKFRQKLDMILSSPNDQIKLRKAKEAFYEYCLTALQVKDVATAFYSDDARLDYATFAYPSVTDKENFYDVYDAFCTFSSAFRLNDFVINTQAGILLPPPHPQTPPLPVNPPPPPPCVVGPQEMMQLTASIKKQSFDDAKLKVAKQGISGLKCFSTMQIKDILVLFSFDKQKLEIAKYAYDYCIDRQNYYQINDVFSFPSDVENLVNYLKTKQ